MDIMTLGMAKMLARGAGGASSWNDLTDKPFYEKSETVELVSNLTKEDYANGNAPSCNFVAGNTYDVIWNGERYSGLVCFSYSEGGVVYNYIVNDDHPFYIEDEGGNGLYIDSEDADYTVTIIGAKTTIKKIDEKYLPDQASLIINGEFDDNYSNVSLDKTYAEIEDAIAKGIDPCIKAGGNVFRLESQGSDDIIFIHVGVLNDGTVFIDSIDINRHTNTRFKSFQLTATATN